jgi:hypothetical protein
MVSGSYLIPLVGLMFHPLDERYMNSGNGHSAGKNYTLTRHIRFLIVDFLT